eukprot:SAG31_NODE_5021_length_2799_cov_1.728519_2_plen_273_part_00
MVRIVIIGCGAIGSYVGGMLTKAGSAEVVLVDIWPEHVEMMKAHGLTVKCGFNKAIYADIGVCALHLHELQAEASQFDYGFIAVKSYDTAWATTLLKQYVRDDGAFVSFQNGYNEPALAEAVGSPGKCLGCVITIAAGCETPGFVERWDARANPFHFGEQQPPDCGSLTNRQHELVELFKTAGVGGADGIGNLVGERWAKLSVNCYVNALGGLSGLGSSTLRINPLGVAIGTQLSAETIRVGRASGIDVSSFSHLFPPRIPLRLPPSSYTKP